MKQQIALISDIHGNIDALTAVLKDIDARGISNIYCAGDSVGSNANQVVTTLREKNISCVIGNHDNSVLFCDMKKTPTKWTKENLSLENISFLQNLPTYLSFTTFETKIYLTHGSPVSISEYLFEDDTQRQYEIAKSLEQDILVFGHTHIGYTKEILGKLFINPGSVGRPKDGDSRASYAILTIEHQSCDVALIRVKIP